MNSYLVCSVVCTTEYHHHSSFFLMIGKVLRQAEVFTALIALVKTFVAVLFKRKTHLAMAAVLKMLCEFTCDFLLASGFSRAS